MDNKFLKVLLDYDYKINSNKYKLNNLESELERLNTKVNSINLETMKNDIESNIFVTTGNKINIKIT